MNHVVALLLLLTSGCAVGWNVGAGPTVDTEGNVGFLVTGRMGFGLGGDKTGVTVGIEGGVGPALDAPLGTAIAMSAVDLFRLERNLMWRIGFRGGWTGRFDDRTAEHWIVVGGAVAVLSYENKRAYSGGKRGGGSTTARGLGGELRVLAGVP